MSATCENEWHEPQCPLCGSEPPTTLLRDTPEDRKRLAAALDIQPERAALDEADAIIAALRGET